MKKLLTYFAVVFSILGLYACLEDKGYTELTKGSNLRPVVSLFGGQNNRYSAAIQISPAEELPINISIGGASTDLTVTFQMDGQPAVDTYNAELLDEYIAEAKANGDTLADGTGDPAGFVPFILLPSNLYTIPSLDVPVKRGVTSADLKVVFNSSAMSLTAKYCLPLTIASVSGDSRAVISESQKSILMYVQLKNKYDGIYTLTGTMVDLTSTTLTGYYPWQVALVTNGANQVILYDNEGFSPNPIHIIKSGTAFSSYGNFGVIINLDPATGNVTSVSNYYTDPLPRGRTAVLEPTGINKWDDATKTLKISYWLYQANIAGNKRTRFDEVFTYKKVR